MMYRNMFATKPKNSDGLFRNLSYDCTLNVDP